jgi:hypothetical protein
MFAKTLDKYQISLFEPINVAKEKSQSQWVQYKSPTTFRIGESTPVTVQASPTARN